MIVPKMGKPGNGIGPPAIRGAAFRPVKAFSLGPEHPSSGPTLFRVRSSPRLRI
ncbi:MAG: hypothetical protein OXD29_04895 [Roseovarius sp.]|nr:hypothetical protein [Roseovarius sp.]MCY4207273.1 hypothetical protein [Roseovarius sp.]MCY4292103.1 hypothetical protein [Roseovarius sp.]MCY4315870.1 hypothetical protein [Roseovarius sp.]